MSIYPLSSTSGSRLVSLVALSLSGAMTMSTLVGLLISSWFILPGALVGGISGLLMAAFCQVAGQQALEEETQQVGIAPALHVCQGMVNSGGAIPLCHECQACTTWRYRPSQLPNTSAFIM